MSHLTCVKHKSRVMVLGSGTTVHRKDGFSCDSPKLVIAGNQFTAQEILSNTHQVFSPRFSDSAA